MKVRSTAIAICLAVIAGMRAVHAQEPSSVPPAANLLATINVFLDCGHNCDFDFIRTEIPYVNWVRDRTDADVHLLVTSQGTGGGGSEYVLNFIGQRAFAQATDTLKYVASVDATSDDRRKGYTRAIKTGLVRYLARTSAADRLQINVTAPSTATAAAATAQHDPWRAWVFSISANGNVNGEKTYQSLNGWFNLNANRTTEAFKSSIGGDFSYDQSDVKVGGGNSAGTGDTTYTTIKRNWGANTSQIKSLTEHWSSGLTGSIGSNSYSNQRRFIHPNIAVEYDLFPYKESTRRQLRFQYGVGFAHYQYEDTTIYFKIRETVPTHYGSIAFSARQPWGSASANFSHNALLKDPSVRSTRLSANTNLRILKGLSFNMSGSYGWIHDQLYLRKGTISTTNVLLRQQQLKTSYRYFAYAGLSYTFGSIFNNVVNPRFGNGGGDSFFFFF